MGTIYRPILVDDLDGTECTELTTVNFVAGGKPRMLELSEENAANLTKLIDARDHAIKLAEAEYHATLADIETEHATRTAVYVEAAVKAEKQSKPSGPAVRVGKRPYNRKAVAQPAPPIARPVASTPASTIVDGVNPLGYAALTKPEKDACRTWAAGNGYPLPLPPRLPNVTVAAWRASLDKPAEAPLPKKALAKAGKAPVKAAGKAAGKPASKPPVATFSGAE